MVKFKIVFLTFFMLLVSMGYSFAQCAMCRATLETNVSNGAEENLAGTLNLGIIYLFAAPYVLVAVIGYLWYKQSRKSATFSK